MAAVRSPEVVPDRQNRDWGAKPQGTSKIESLIMNSMIWKKYLRCLRLHFQLKGCNSTYN